MKIMRKPLANSVIVTIFSAFYALAFGLTSGHREFDRILDHSVTLNSPFWNSWTLFLRQGNLRYVGYAYAAATAMIVLLSLARRRDYDEYQAGFFEKGAAASGAALLLLFPLAFLLIVSDPGYAVEAVTFLVTAHWSVLLLADLLCVVRWGRT